MFLPIPDKPIKISSTHILYHYYPMDFTLIKEVADKDRNGRTYFRQERNWALAYANIVLPYRDAEAYKRARTGYIDFGLDYVVNTELTKIYYHNCYGVSNLGVRALTNIVAYHNYVYDGTNPETAYIVIGGVNVLEAAMVSILRHLTTLPFLDKHVPAIIKHAMANRPGVLRRTDNPEWATPRWIIYRDLNLWDAIISDWFRGGNCEFV